MLEAVYFFLKYIKAVFYINYFSKPLSDYLVLEVFSLMAGYPNRCSNFLTIVPLSYFTDIHVAHAVQ